MENNAKRINGNNKVEIKDILTNDFINKNTDFNNLDEFIKAGNITAKDFQTMNSSKLDPLVQKHSSFNSYKEFELQARKEWVANHIMP